MTEHLKDNPYPTEPEVNKGPLPDLFLPPAASERIAGKEEWATCAAVWRDLILDLEYGGMPPQPESIAFECHSHNVRRNWPGKPKYWGYKIHCTGGVRPFSFTVKILYPDSDKPVPAIINGDACWWRSEEIAKRVVEKNCALVLFDRTELAKDASNRNERTGGLYDVYPGQTFSALSSWAWGYHRVVDLLVTLPFIDSGHIAISGHSRGGKTTLLAAATDERIALINDNASCAAGGAVFRYVGNGGETITIQNTFPDWFNPAFRAYIGKEDQLPFDQHCLLAVLAPRPVLLSYALDDRWSNPEGMVQCYWAGREAWKYLGAEERLAFHLRPGGHAHNMDDWNALLDFIDWQWFGHEPQSAFNQHPYSHLKPIFDWQSPQ